MALTLTVPWLRPALPGRQAGDHLAVWDGLFNHDFSGASNTPVVIAEGQCGTTETYRYATLNVVHFIIQRNMAQQTVSPKRQLAQATHTLGRPQMV